ncbi:hypothetical protein BOVA713_3123 [Bacteroides ovatus]|uniref:Uncharacterized protein n=1 Tax=Bacteroides ovatus (strain ATCC 8483 / DSM 1896 / JCM 5824 / BCRC 10623 / CCUG 4943 / NCTC 11153) TaxID=411476 RepID=A0AAN3ACJ7_BACO1|nr:hypothetical protein BACOVA_00262 [Bacteroides ovatus ATCC 8483]CAG9898622.1 hypothetical protein BOVA713_3123 [Bacteroides ovatus]
MYYPYFHSGFKQISYFIWVTIQKYDKFDQLCRKTKHASIHIEHPDTSRIHKSVNIKHTRQ